MFHADGDDEVVSFCISKCKMKKNYDSMVNIMDSWICFFFVYSLYFCVCAGAFSLLLLNSNFETCWNIFDIAVVRIALWKHDEYYLTTTSATATTQHQQHTHLYILDIYITRSKLHININALSKLCKANINYTHTKNRKRVRKSQHKNHRLQHTPQMCVVIAIDRMNVQLRECV